MKWSKQLPKRGTILDIGCGMGNHTIALAKLEFNVISFDASPEAVKQTKHWLKKEGLSASVTCADFRSFDFGKNRFDGILSMNVIHHGAEADVRKVIRKIYQSLKPGGLLLTTVPPQKYLNRYKKIGKSTFVPIDGSEKEIKHVLFTKALIDDMFSDFILSPPRRDHIEHFVIVGSKS